MASRSRLHFRNGDTLIVHRSTVDKYHERYGELKTATVEDCPDDCCGCVDNQGEFCTREKA